MDLEEKCFRHIILQNLKYLRRLYEQYALIGTFEAKIPFKPIMVRMFLWQLYRNCDIPNKGLSLVKTDKLLFEIPEAGLETLHHPFEKIYFSQFLYSLLSIAWELYGTYNFLQGKSATSLASIFKKFLICDIIPKANMHKGDFKLTNV